MQRDGRDQTAAAAAEPGEHDARGGGGDDRPQDAQHLTGNPASEEPGQPLVTRRQSQRRRDVPETEHQRSGREHATCAVDPAEGALQHAAERELLGDDGLQRDDDHRRDERTGQGGVPVGHEEGAGDRQGRADRHDADHESHRRQRVQRTLSPVPGREPQFDPAESAAAGEHEQHDSGDGNGGDARPRGGEVCDQIRGHEDDHHDRDVEVGMQHGPLRACTGRLAVDSSGVLDFKGHSAGRSGS